MRRLMWFTIGFCLACLLAVYFLSGSLLGWAALTGCVCGAAALLLRPSVFVKRRTPPPARGGDFGRPMSGNRGDPGSGCPAILRLVCGGLALGLIWCWGYDALRLSPARAAEGSYERLEAELRDYPVRTDYGWQADGWAIVDGQRIHTRFYLYGELPELEPGDRIAGSFTLRRADRTKEGETPRPRAYCSPAPAGWRPRQRAEVPSAASLPGSAAGSLCGWQS